MSKKPWYRSLPLLRDYFSSREQKAGQQRDSKIERLVEERDFVSLVELHTSLNETDSKKLRSRLPLQEFISFFQNHQDQKQRSNALSVLGYMLCLENKEKELLTLVQEALEDSSYQVRAMAVLVLSDYLDEKHNYELILPLLVQKLCDPHPAVRSDVIKVLSLEVGDVMDPVLEKSGFLPALQQLLESENEIEILAAALSLFPLNNEEGQRDPFLVRTAFDATMKLFRKEEIICSKEIGEEIYKAWSRDSLVSRQSYFYSILKDFLLNIYSQKRKVNFFQ